MAAGQPWTISSGERDTGVRATKTNHSNEKYNDAATTTTTIATTVITTPAVSAAAPLVLSPSAHLPAAAAATE